MLVFFAGVSLPAQDLLPRDVLMLARIRDRVRQTVERLPDCTCIESVARFRKAPGKTLQPTDKLVLQVLFSGGKELFARPGETRWESDLLPFMISGMMGNGIFALHLRAVFLNNQSLIRYHGMESDGGRMEARYDFSISRMLSGFQITYGNASGVVGERGSFWADPETYEVRRLEFHADDMPPELLYRDVFTSIRYGRVLVGDGYVPLPQTAELRTLDINGEEDRNVIEFTHCQAFHTESTLTFPGYDSSAAPAKRMTEGTLPADLRLTVVLREGLDEHTAAGSLVEGAVAGNVVHKGKVLVPAGAPVKGRVRRLDRHDEDPGYFTVTLEFDSIETSSANLRFYAELEDVDRSSNADLALNAKRHAHGSADEPAGVGTFFVRGGHFLLPPGFKTVWKTQLYP